MLMSEVSALAFSRVAALVSSLEFTFSPTAFSWSLTSLTNSAEAIWLEYSHRMVKGEPSG